MANPEMFKKLKGQMPSSKKDEMLDSADLEMEIELAPEEDAAEEEMMAEDVMLADATEEELMAELEKRKAAASKPGKEPAY